MDKVETLERSQWEKARERVFVTEARKGLLWFSTACNCSDFEIVEDCAAPPVDVDQFGRTT